MTGRHDGLDHEDCRNVIALVFCLCNCVESVVIYWDRQCQKITTFQGGNIISPFGFVGSNLPFSLPGVILVAMFVIDLELRVF